MPEDLPPLDALRAFERAAHTLSFKRAAQELHVSPSALSRRIQGLEAHLGVALFKRLNPGLALTTEGARYLEGVHEALTALGQAHAAVAPVVWRPLRVSATESFCANWLVPRLDDFEAAHPGIALELETTFRYADFERDEVDAAIRFGTGPWEGLHAEPIAEVRFFPVCAPALTNGSSPLSRPADLSEHVLIHVTQIARAWSLWLAEAGLPDLEPRRHVTYDHVEIALRAAEAGQGVALGTRINCNSQLESRRLVQPFALEVRAPPTYHFQCRPEGLSDPRVTALRDWLVASLDGL